LLQAEVADGQQWRKQGRRKRRIWGVGAESRRTLGG